MKEDENACVWAELRERIDRRGVVVEVARDFAARRVKDVDQDRHVPEGVLALRGKVGLVEDVLASAVPQVEHEASEKPPARRGARG